MLHILINSPYKCDFCLFFKFFKKRDDILLIQDGVIAALKNTKINKKLLKNTTKIFALKEDIYARGFNKIIADKIKVIDYSGFVKLTIKNRNQITW